MSTHRREALDVPGTTPFDLLLLDIHMPQLDGFQVIREIRQREQSAGGHLPVIALTARSRQEDRRAGRLPLWCNLPKYPAIKIDSET